MIASRFDQAGFYGPQQGVTMRIDRVTLYHLRMTLASPFETSFGRQATRDCVLLEVNAEGLTGYGECVADYAPGYASETVGTAWYILQEFIVPPLLGQDVADPEDFQTRAAGVRGHRMAKAGLEMALWDLEGKREGKSLRTLFGGIHDRVSVGSLRWDSGQPGSAGPHSRRLSQGRVRPGKAQD